MAGNTGKKIMERRSSDRVIDDSILMVTGYSVSGLPFSEITKINDVSHGGISFHLRTPIEIDTILEVSICSSKFKEPHLSPLYQVKARVLRISKAGANEEASLIAARFQGEFVKLSCDYQSEDMAKELQEAIELDERMREQYESKS